MKKLLISLIVLTILSTASVFAADPGIAILKPIGEPSESGYQAYGMFDSDGNLIEPAQRTPQISLFSRLPEKYDSRDYGYISPIRNQGQFGTCWAHAFVACAEANMIKKGYEASFNNYSELHLAYFYHKRNEAQGDGEDVFDTSSNNYGYFGAGNGTYAAQFAESFQALAVESDFPYSMISGSADFVIDEKYRNHSDVHMVDYGEILDAEDAKKAIMEYGAISVGYASLNGYISEDAAYYQNIYDDTNHEVAVIGWDDNFPVEKFNQNCRPQSPGAWLVKNSYGKLYGDFGYMWLSYEDPSINLGGYYEFEPIGNENKVHTYNGSYADLMWNIPKSANIFKAEEDQTVYAVSFDSVTNTIVPEKYEINIYVSDSKPSDPESGTHKVKLSGSIERNGFHHIDLDTPIELTAGQYLSVVVRQADSDGNNAAHIFESGDDFTSREGESWAYTGSRWINTYNYTNSGYKIKNATIKAYYKTNTATVNFNTREAEHFNSVTVNVGECAPQPQDPEKEGFEFLGWYSNNTVTDKWDFSTPITHDMVLFAKWSEPENVDMKIRSTVCNLNGEFRPTVKLFGDNIENLTFYFTKDGKPYTYFSPSDLNSGWIIPLPLGKYTVFAYVTGINGEEITSDTETFTVTDKPAISVHEGLLTTVNVPDDGADLYVAQYDDEDRFISVKKQTITVPNSIGNAPTDYSNPRFFLWSLNGTTPLCEAVE
ncbi:MAG: InlB B-repeat-containing protein [Clostridia bacterium]|nr:InlB B-repeat-containing protein [Clostridia bacterium]